MIAVLGCGPSGLIAANYLQLLGIEDVTVISAGPHGFDTQLFDDMPYKKGQRTLFANRNLDRFFVKLGIGCTEKEDLSNCIAVKYGDRIYDYPIQNNLKGMSLFNKIRMYGSYLARNHSLAKSSNFADWVIGTYGQFLSKNIILPHTWKTIKEDLWNIEAKHYGKKVIPIKFFKSKQKSVYGYKHSNSIMHKLNEQINNRICGNIVSVDGNIVKVVSEGVEIEISASHIINTIALPKFMNFFNSAGNEVIDVANRSLHYNNMFVAILVVPTKFINCSKKILYFPERKYLFSKVNIDKLNGYSVITCEISFRRNDDDLFKSKAYRNKILDKVEYDLKEAGILYGNMFAILDRTSTIISPAYIICDFEYEMYNTILQTYLERKKVYNVGRFSMWEPNLRVEHSLARISDICEKLFPEHKRLT